MTCINRAISKRYVTMLLQTGDFIYNLRIFKKGSTREINFKKWKQLKGLVMKLQEKDVKVMTALDTCPIDVIKKGKLKTPKICHPSVPTQKPSRPS